MLCCVYEQDVTVQSQFATALRQATHPSNLSAQPTDFQGHVIEQNEVLSMNCENNEFNRCQKSTLEHFAPNFL